MVYSWPITDNWKRYHFSDLSAKHQTLSTLSPVRLWFFQRLGPFFATVKLPAANVSSQSNWPRWSSSERNLGHILGQTSCSSHCCNLGQQVLADGYRLAKSFQLAPLRNSQIMRSNTALLPLGFRPPLAEGLGVGRQGSSLIHCSSVTNGFCLAIKSSFLHPTRHNSFRGRKFKLYLVLK